MTKLALLFVIGFVLFVALFELLAQSSPVFINCIEHHEKADGPSTTEKNTAGFKTVLKAYATCALEFFDTHGNGITAFATVIIALFSLVLWLTSYWQWKVSSQTLALQFRPKLIVRNVIVVPFYPEPNDNLPMTITFVKDKIVKGQFDVVNTGGGAALITESLCLVHWRKGQLPMRRPYEGRNGNNPIEGNLIAGECRVVGFTSDIPCPLSHLELGSMDVLPLTPPIWHLWVMGWIEYTDDLRFKRRTSFCRLYKHDANRFVVVEDADYEHIE
jgi:hypothetical protein